MRFQRLLIPLCFAGFLLFAGRASAATFDLLTDKTTVNADDTFTLSVTMNTEGVGVNAAEATVSFPTELVEATGVDTSGSVFNFWVVGPSYSNESGRINFLGGSTNGFSGGTLPVVRVRFKVKKAGTIDFTFLDGAITASDGQGTNVLTAMHSATVLGAAAPQPKPTQIVREAVPATVVSTAPKVQIAAYPDETKWYNSLSPFLARWTLPADVTDVSTVLNQQPRTVPQASEGLFDNKLFRVTSDGIWYLHVRFRNNIGWGETLHYRIAVDTVPPAAFDVDVQEGTVTDTPDPKLTFSTNDPISGLSEYVVRVDRGSATSSMTTEQVLSPLKPGKHTITVAAVDRASNRTEATVDLTILPIAAPTISALPKVLYYGEGALSVGGTTAAGTELDARLLSVSGSVLEAKNVKISGNGTWSATFDRPLQIGQYSIEVVAKDDRGASSLPVHADFVVKQKPFFTIAGVEFSQTIFFLILVALLGGGYFFGWRMAVMKKKKRSNRALIAQRDVAAAYDQVTKELTMLAGRIHSGTLEAWEGEEIKTVIERVLAKLKEFRQYLLDSIEDINKP